LGEIIRLLRRDIDLVEKDVLEIGVAIGAQDADRVIDVAVVDRIAALEQIVQLAQQLAGQRLLDRGRRRS
jgi:copper homeostasis protein CutC